MVKKKKKNSNENKRCYKETANDMYKTLYSLRLYERAVCERMKLNGLS